MKIVIAIAGLVLIAAWIEQTLARRRRKRPAQWWKEPDDDY